METVMGPFRLSSDRQPPPYEIVSSTTVTQKAGDHVRAEIRYQAVDGTWVPAFLLTPTAPPPAEGRPVALALHGTQLELGAGIVVGLGGKPLSDYGLRLVAAGFGVLAPHYPTMAGYDVDFTGLGWRSGTMKAVCDNVTGLDLVCSLPGMSSRVVALGNSLGGHNSLFTASFDPRITAVVSSCGFDSFRDYQGGDLAGWLQGRYMPHLADQDPPAFDFDDVLTAVADRQLFVSAPLHDDNFVAASVDRLVEATRPVRDEAGGHLELRHPDCGHQFPADVQDEAIAFAQKALHA